MIALTGDEHRVLRALGCDPELIEAHCHARPKWIDDVMAAVTTAAAFIRPEHHAVKGTTDMARTEVRTFEYACDGWLVDGRRCIETRRVEAESEDAADRTISTQAPWSVQEPWTRDVRGWLCTRDHRTD